MCTVFIIMGNAGYNIFMKISRVVEYGFFFILLGVSAYMVWLIFQPFVSALALSAIIVTICYPLYKRIRAITPKKSKSLAALSTTILVLVVIVIPLAILSSMIAREVISFYDMLSAGQQLSIESGFDNIESVIAGFIPGFELNITEQLQEIVAWFTGNLAAIFAGTVSTLFTFMIAMIGSFYFFRDGKDFLELIVKISPLPDHEDKIIFKRMALAVRGVAVGTLLVAIVQGVLVALGFAVVGIDRVVLWGTVTAVLAVIPGIGTGFVTFPAIFYLLYNGQLVAGIALTIWSVFVVGLIDNILGPYLMSRGNPMHPFIILISVLGGLALFGPVGFIVGPVIVTLFLVLLEIYSQYIIQEQRPSPKDVAE